MEIYLEDNTLITSKTDLKGHITYGNADFIRFSGYKESEFLNKPHNIIRHQDMPRIAFKLLWDNVQNGREFLALLRIFRVRRMCIGSLPTSHPHMMSITTS